MQKSSKIVIMGLGLHGGGVGVVKYFVSQKAEVIVTDLKNSSQLKESVEELKGLKVKFVLGKHREEDFKNADMIIKNPDVPSSSPFLEIARKNNIPIKDDISLFFDLCPGEIIGVTGTKGKSTVATLIYELLKSKFQTVLAGNIGISPLEFLSDIKKDSKVVLELSSFALENLQKSPQIAVITNLFPDHLNRYEGFREYIEAKKAIFKYQDKKDVLILNNNDPESKKLVSEAKGKVIFFDNYNTDAAIKVAELFKIPENDIQRIISTFKGVPHRQEFIKEVNGKKYFNDTTATNPRAVKFALETFKKNFPNSKIILIAGGEDKKLSYRALAKDIEKNVERLVLLPGSASNLIKRDLKKFKIYNVKSMTEAVKRASQLDGDIVILSPGAASFTPHHFLKKGDEQKNFRKNGAGFNLFKNEFDRGIKFIKAVNKL